MTIVVQTTDGSIEFSDTCIQAVARRAEFVAALTAHGIRTALHLLEYGPGVQTLTAPAGFLLELGTVFVLASWEAKGISAHIEVGLPSSNEADADLVRRLQQDPKQFDVIDSTGLSSRVLRFWLENFAWDGLESVDSDLLLSAVDEDSFLDSLADFLWRNRQSMPTELRD
jgi:hypothetical protein